MLSISWHSYIHCQEVILNLPIVTSQRLQSHIRRLQFSLLANTGDENMQESKRGSESPVRGAGPIVVPTNSLLTTVSTVDMAVPGL